MRRLCFSILMPFAICCVAQLTIEAQYDDVKVPAQVAAFVEGGTKAIAVERADLNGDGRKDFILVLQREKPQMDKEDLPINERPLLILIAGADGRLSLAGRSEKVVLCSRCGGAMGDPFQGVVAKTRTFSVSHYGGAAERWSNEYKFNYSPRDKTWQLVRAEESSFQATDPSKEKTKIYIPPRDYGKIDIADFDPDHYLKKKP